MALPRARGVLPPVTLHWWLGPGWPSCFTLQPLTPFWFFACVNQRDHGTSCRKTQSLENQSSWFWGAQAPTLPLICSLEWGKAVLDKLMHRELEQSLPGSD